MWYQYTVADGVIRASNTLKVDDNVLAKIGRAQIEGEPINIALHKVDISKKTPVIVAVAAPKTAKKPA